MAKVYKWADGSRAKGDVQAVGEQLDAIREAHGLLKDELVVEAAREESSPLHGFFQWDDTEAARKYRLLQAGMLIRSVRVVVSEAPHRPPTRAFFHVSDATGKGYQAADLALRDVDQRTELLADALRQLRALQRKYADLKELAEVFRQIEAAENSLTKAA